MTAREAMERLDGIGVRAPHTQGVMIPATEYCWSIFKRHVVGSSILELGPAEGVMTELMVKAGFTVTAVEGSPLLAKALESRLPDVTVVNCLFEEFEPMEKFDTIVLSHVLEHLDDPDAILSSLRSWLRPGGVVVSSVPNANSLHRQAAVYMGTLSHVGQLNATDMSHGHMRVYTPESFHDVFRRNHLQIKESGGYWLKTLANFQIEAWYTTDMFDAYLRLGETYPSIAAEIYIVACPDELP